MFLLTPSWPIWSKLKFPVDIHSILLRLFRTDTRYNETDIEPILKSIEDKLAERPSCVCVGIHLWVYCTVIEELANRIALDTRDTATPVPLEVVFHNKWPEFCRDHPAFPDHYSESALAEALQNLHVKVLANKFIVSEKTLPVALDAFAHMIDKADQPLRLTNQIPLLFPNLSASPEAISAIENYLTLNLDNRFIEFISGWYLTKSLLRFDSNSFEDLFSNEYFPIPTKRLLKAAIS